MVIFNGDYMVIIWKNYLEKLSRDYPRYDGKATNIEGKILRKPSVKNSQINI